MGLDDVEGLKEREKDRKDGSMTVILATNAPLHPAQLQRLAKRATMGLARGGGWGSKLSGDIFLAFSTAMRWIYDQRIKGCRKEVNVKMIDALLEASEDVVKEAILKAVFIAETIEGNGNRVEERVKELMGKYL